MEKSVDTIHRIKEAMGDNLAILGHHYQSDDVVALTDIRGDSLELSRRISSLDAEHIVFCGVYFMAESAAILQRSGQKIYIPDITATCPMADMADAKRVEKTLEILQSNGRKVIPLTYVNSSAAVKGVVGRFDGSVCTSANAERMLKWACEQGDSVLFLPDKHLARNTAHALGIPLEKQLVQPEGIKEGVVDLFVDSKVADDKELIIWPGYCPIHEEFTLKSIQTIRLNEPDAHIVVHPECAPEVVAASDGHGSTTFLIKYASEAPSGSTVYIGTEENLVNRLAQQFKSEKTIKPLAVSRCDDMGKTTIHNLANLLENIHETVPVTVAEEIREPAKWALERMLKVCA
ncbi:quinolinate synthase NadA [Pseudodesulfovibrio piezophilus]|uniref:Quinolinate synthase n=1 Tax=Pseudodesulfovibrio piezophilus (strain DSM 21447 / JCM 15486 / C1TLV30) TaxID=1322246 RepID=M1WLD9_PSEP2|nr:quinolinate synthase NadA [Pseudodesulfovibrio piezophilus]CCH47695.1 Quinolinate synthase A [Pseudodesulfovibrio piezophilus C1TLV30]